MLAARDAREALAGRVLERARSRGAGAMVWMTVNVPGADKQPPGIGALFASATRAVAASQGDAEVAAEGVDALGQYRALVVRAHPIELKPSMVRLEETLVAGRLLDLDVCDTDGVPVDRARLGLPQRTCLVCPEPARDCIRLRAHSPGELASAVATLLAPFVLISSPPLSPEALARALMHGAMLELELTPKPGLVDRLDNGSHTDLSFDLMARSIALLPVYYDELLALRRQRAPLTACVDAGRSAEQRMFEAIGTNAHRGYIFLSGLVLLAACDLERADVAAARADEQIRLPALRACIRALAREFFGRGASAPAVGASNPDRTHPGVAGGGIRAEALGGLPSVFEAGLPALSRGLAGAGHGTLAPYAVLAVLMQRVEDTTALHRCDQAGLDRLRRDGAALANLIDRGADPLPVLRRWNDDYRRMRLTMGGVADCMALVFALHLWGAPQARIGAL